jgi:serpin B
MSPSTLLRPLLALLLLAAVLPACGEDAEAPEASAPTLTAGQQRFGASFPGDLLDNVPERETPSQAPAEDIRQANLDQQRFATGLFALAEAQHPGANHFFSPFSVGMAFAMSENPVAFSLPFERLHPANNGVQLELLKHSGVQRGPEGDPVIFNLANGVWLDSSDLSDAQRAEIIAAGDTSGIFGRYYDAPIALLDMQTDRTRAEAQLNAWVSDRTNGLIPDLLRGNIVSGTTQVSISALYFKAPWAEPFEEYLTEPSTFTLGDTTTVEVPTFHSYSRAMSTYPREGLEVAALPYASSGLELVFLMPPVGELDALVDALSPELLEEIAAGLSPEQLTFAMPRFEVETSLDLKALLEDPFSSANHQAIIRIDEEGTEAAAATVVADGDNNAPGPPRPSRELKIDRPFLFLIWDRPSRTIAFAGKVVDPR